MAARLPRDPRQTRFTQADWGWVVVSIGMAVGAGIVFLPVEVGRMGLWVFLLSALIGYPSLFLFQRLYGCSVLVCWVWLV